jgi:hypothetical protein
MLAGAGLATGGDRRHDLQSDEGPAAEAASMGMRLDRGRADQEGTNADDLLLRQCGSPTNGGKEGGFYCFVGIEQDASGTAKERLLALALGIGGLRNPAIEVTFKQETLLDLFNPWTCPRLSRNLASRKN